MLPAPLTQRHTYTDLTEGFGTAGRDEGLPRVGLAHGYVQGILSSDIDATNPIAAGRADEAGLAYLALGDWHGTKLVDDKTWYAGTPETDRFKNNDSGQALLVRLSNAGAVVTVTPVNVGRYRWQFLERELAVASDVDALVAELTPFGADDVLQVRITGTCSLAGHRQLSDALGTTKAKARAVVWDSTRLRLQLTEEDVQALHADGFVGEVLQELRAAQGGEASELARDALMALATVLDAQRPRTGNTP